MSWHSSRSRVPDERARSASEDPGPRGDTARSLRQMQVRASFTRVVASIRRFASLALGPGLVPLGCASLHSPGTRELAPASRVPDERACSAREDPGPRGDTAGRADAAFHDSCAGSRVSFRFATLARDTRVRSGLACPGRARAQRARRSGTQGRHGTVAAISPNACRVTRRGFLRLTHSAATSPDACRRSGRSHRRLPSFPARRDRSCIVRATCPRTPAARPPRRRGGACGGSAR
jgi:hypothetical protein